MSGQILFFSMSSARIFIGRYTKARIFLFTPATRLEKAKTKHRSIIKKPRRGFGMLVLTGGRTRFFHVIFFLIFCRLLVCAYVYKFICKLRNGMFEFQMINIFVYVECSNFTYGQNCSRDCTCVQNNTLTCEPETGACLCRDGWTGTNCDGGRYIDPLIIENTIGLVLGPSTALCRSFLKHCTLTNKAVGTI